MSRLIHLVLIYIIALETMAQSDTDSLIHALKTNTNDSLRVEAAIGLYDLMINQYPDSLFIILQDAYTLACDKGFQKNSIRLLIRKGQVYGRLNNYLEAQKVFILARSKLDSIRAFLPDTSYQKLMLSLGNNMAIIFFKTGKLEDAKKKYQEILIVLDSLLLDSPMDWVRSLYMTMNMNLGSVYLQALDYEQAEHYYLKAMANLSPDNKTARSSLLNNLGIIEKDRGNYEKSYDYLFRAMEIRKQSGDTEGIIQTLNNIGNLLFKMKNYPSALDTLTKARRLAQENQFLRSETIALELLSGIYAELEDYQNAFFTQRDFKARYDSLMNQENLQNITQLEMQQRFQEKLKEENYRRGQEDLERQKQETMYLFAMIISLMLFAIFIMLYALQRSKLKRQQLLADKESLKRKSLELENEKLNLDLEFKNKELTTNVIYLARSNEFISDLAQKLMKIRLNLSRENQKLIDALVRDLQTFSDRDTWKEFELRFQEVHSDFYKKLLEKFPDLSSNEKKLCAFLRLNMTTKEISAITYQSVNSITVARSRLRRKLGVDQDENLVAFLEKL